jgi:hypothetical protein
VRVGTEVSIGRGVAVRVGRGVGDGARVGCRVTIGGWVGGAGRSVGRTVEGRIVLVGGGVPVAVGRVVSVFGGRAIVRAVGVRAAVASVGAFGSAVSLGGTDVDALSGSGVDVSRTIRRGVSVGWTVGWISGAEIVATDGGSVGCCVLMVGMT